MPLTFAHPLAAAPFARWGLPLSALVVGAMSPDFIYFLQLRPGHQLGHTLPGLVLWDLPAALVVLWIFHRLLKQPVGELLPPAVQARLAPWSAPFPFLPARRFATVAAAILVGAVSHVVWDSFTHQTGAAVVRFEVLERSVGLEPWGSAPVYKLLQHGSTLVGLGLLGLWLLRVLARTRPVAVEPRLAASARWLRLLALTLLPLAAGAAWAWITTAGEPDMLRLFAGRWVVATTTGAFLAAGLYGLATRALTVRRPRPPWRSPPPDSPRAPPPRPAP